MDRILAPEGESPLLVGITGATGAAYGIAVLRAACATGVPVRLTVTRAGERVLLEETGRTAAQWIEDLSREAVESAGQTAGAPLPPVLDDLSDVGAPPASGSFRTRGLIVAPCSMGTLARIAGGISGNLLEREADVCLKERRPLVLLARETPLSAIHLKNMLALTEAGAVIMPPVPAFYAKPSSVEDIVRDTALRALGLMGFDLPGAFRWGRAR